MAQVRPVAHRAVADPDEQLGNPEALLARMRQDKKVTEGKIQLILLRSLGQAMVSAQATEEDLRSLWNNYTA